MTTLYLFDSDGFYAGSVDAEPSDPRYLRHTLTSPPEIPVGMFAQWTSGEWRIALSRKVNTGATKMTKLAFRNRFTNAEKIAIELSSVDNPAAPLETRQLQAALRVYLKDLDSAMFIDSQRAETRAGVITLEQMGLIAAGRALQILDLPINDVEIWRSAPYDQTVSV